MGAAVILGNTYHLHFRPGEDVIEELGGLHAFSGWDGPILTDSGGFQVFSLRDTLLAVDDDGVTFRSVYDGAPSGSRPRASPRSSGGSAPTSRCASTSARRPTRRAPSTRMRCGARGSGPSGRSTRRGRPGQLRFGIAQGGTDPELRRRSIEEIVALGFDGNALGGLAVGESRAEMLETVGWAAPLLPADKPRYFMGLGDAEGILGVIAGGHRHVRLRAADPDGADGLGADGDRQDEPAQRPLRPRSAPARGRLRLPRVHRVSRARSSGISSTRTRSSGFACSLCIIYGSFIDSPPERGMRSAAETFDDFRAQALSRLAGGSTGGSVQGILIIVLLFGVLWFAHDPPAAREGAGAAADARHGRARRRDPHRRRHLRHRPGARAGRGRRRPDRRDRRRHPRAHRAQGARDGDQARGRRRGRRGRRRRRRTTTMSSTGRPSSSPTTRSPPPA